jgi:outer membrane immunogenic protein
MFAPQWSVKAEYLYYDLGIVTLNQTLAQLAEPPGAICPCVTTSDIQSAVHYRGNITRAGVNFKFD